MAFEQHVMTHAQWTAAGGWAPALPAVADDWVVIVGYDTDTGEAQWASWDRPTIDPATRLNPSVATVVDFR